MSSVKENILETDMVKPKRGSSKSSHEELYEAEPVRAEYGIDQFTFVKAWETSETVDEVLEKLNEVSLRARLTPMPRGIILDRASSYRQAGIKLKKMKRTSSRSLDVNGLNSLIDQLRATKSAGGVVDLGEAHSPAAPPSPKHDVVRKAVEELLAKLK